MNTTYVKASLLVVASISLILSSCKNKKENFDASGTFETTEILVSAETAGKILDFTLEEGQLIQANQIVGYIDSTQMYLKKLQLIESMQALLSRRPNIRKQMAVLEQQIATANMEQKRIENLVKDNAVGTKQLDDAKAQIAVLEKHRLALNSTLTSTDSGISAESKALEIQLKQVDDQLQKCRITAPISGTVLTKYAEKGELAAPGKALFKIANMDKMHLRVYVTGNQVTTIKVGQKATVYADFGENSKTYEGIISWVSSKSEFTPKTIQTRDERANLVYAVKITVQNDGFLKIGQYGNVAF